MKQLRARTFCGADIEKISDDEGEEDDVKVDASEPATGADRLLVDLRTFIAIGEESFINVECAR